MIAAAVVLVGCSDEATESDVGAPDVGADVPTADASTDPSGDAETDAVVKFEFCDGETELRYDPLGSAELLLYPDDILTVADADSPTGLRLQIDESTPWIVEVPSLLRSVSADLNALSGFAANGAVLLRVTAPFGDVPSGEHASIDNQSIVFADLSTDPPTRVPFDAVLGDGGLDLFLEPLVTLRRGARHAVIVTNALLDEGASCLAPSGPTRETLTDSATTQYAAWTEALVALQIDPGEVSGMTTFTVHDDLGAVTEAASRIRALSYDWIREPACESGDGTLRCELAFDPWDFRLGRYVAEPEPVERWAVDVTVWLPETGDSPFPVVMYGHGLNDRRQSGAAVARRLNPLGIAVVAADAIAHGSHPTATQESTLAALDFLGIDLSTVQVDPLRLRGNFEQTVLDRLQLVEAIRQNPDVTGDGEADLDIGVAGYWGISLGAMLGAPFAALSADMRAVVLSVGGGRLLTFATDTSQVAAFRPLIGNLVGSEELFMRLLPVAQTVVDAADPATYGAEILSGSLHGSPGPSLLFPVATGDETVPPATGRVLARSIGAPQLGTAFFDVETLPLVEGPLVDNLGSGQTAAYYQIDRVSAGEGVVEANHDNAPLSPELSAQAVEFLRSALLDGPPRIIDPLVEMETPALP